MSNMIMHTSMIKENGYVEFPEFTGERIYMRPFNKTKGLPKDLKRWQSTVDAMLDGIDTEGDVYLMVDQGIVHSGMTHRRAGRHIDGYWIPNIKCHGGGGRHRGDGGGGRHRGDGKHTGAWDRGGGRWKNCSFDKAEALILASDVKACSAYLGQWKGDPGEGGDCEQIDISRMEKILLEPNKIYIGNVAMIHESLPVLVDCQRTLVRINVPNYDFALEKVN